MSARIALAAGGTGGHMFPAEALAGELLSRGHRVALITDRRGGGFGERLPAVETHRIAAGGLAGTGIVGRARGIVQLGLGFVQSRGLLGRLKPAVAVGFGLQAVINMASTLHLMPTKGMTLPFISYGGSSLLALSLAMGMVLALTRRRAGLGDAT